MTREHLLAKVHDLLRAAGGYAVVQVKGTDITVQDVRDIDVLDAARALAHGLGHTGIDIRPDADNYEALDAMIEDRGCDSCGHGSVLVLRGILAGPWPQGACP